MEIVYSVNNIRVIADKFSRKYDGLDKRHVYWIAKKMDIYPDGLEQKKKQFVSEAKTGRINKENKKYVTKGKMNSTAIQDIESYILSEGYKMRPNYQEEKKVEARNIWEQADLIAMMKKDYEKVVEELNKAKAELKTFSELAEEYEKENEELKDKALILEKENCDLKNEKKELGQIQLKTVDFNKEIDDLQLRIAKLNQGINLQISDLNELRKDFSAMQASMNRMQDNKKKLDGVLSDLIGCSKRLMNMK